jgi:hypothetical protein
LVDAAAPEDLDAFLDRLLDGARSVKAAKANQVNIPEAARLAFCMSEEIVRLILGQARAQMAAPR